MTTKPQGLGSLATIVESARQTWNLSRRDRLWWFVAAILVLVPALAFVLAGRAEDGLGGRGLFCLMAWWLHGTVIVPWLTLYLGVQAVHGRIEDRTFQYLFLRPVRKVALLAGNWIAVASMAGGTGVLGMGLLFGAVALRGDLWPDGIEWGLAGAFAVVAGAAAAAYAAVAVLFGAFFRRPLVWAAFFVVGVQMLAANLPVSAGLRRLTITDPLRRLLLDGIEPDRRLAQMLWPAERDFRPELIEHPLRDLLLLGGLCLVAAGMAYARTEYDSRERE
ncbi:MAG: ABC transporter permease subunit [Planctomycetes bacterium]|nr:ABC transporter permease subunit [Planctomycetota bacterium]